MQRQKQAAPVPVSAYLVVLFILLTPAAASLSRGKSPVPKASAMESTYRAVSITPHIAAPVSIEKLTPWPVAPVETWPLPDIAALPDVERLDTPLARIGWPSINNVDAELASARAYLIKTARPGFTMIFQGVPAALECFHPKFAVGMAAAIREARGQGLDVGVSSACRPPWLKVGGFLDKFMSMHAYGNAADMAGVGRPGSAEHKRWHRVAVAHGLVNPYFDGQKFKSRKRGKIWVAMVWEWNHYQLFPDTVAPPALRQTIAAKGSPNLERTWRVADAVLGKHHNDNRKSKRKRYQRVASR